MSAARTVLRAGRPVFAPATGLQETKRGGGPPQSKTLARGTVAPGWREGSWTVPVPWRFFGLAAPGWPSALQVRPGPFGRRSGRRRPRSRFRSCESAGDSGARARGKTAGNGDECGACNPP